MTFTPDGSHRIRFDRFIEPTGPHLIMRDHNLGEIMLLYEWGTPPEPWLFMRVCHGHWVSLRRATADDLALFHGLAEPPITPKRTGAP